MDAVFRDYASEVSRWAARLGGPELDVDDVVQDVFLVVRKRLPEFRGDAKLSTWLYRITLRVVQQQLRRRRLRRRLGLRLEELPEPASGGTPQSSLEQAELTREVYRILDTLPENQRTALILFELEGWSGEEIAELLGKKAATVWVWLHRGRAQFVERASALARREGLR